MSTVSIDVASEVTPELVEAMSVLVPQLSSSSAAPTFEELDEIVRSPATDLIVARIDGRIVGAMTLVIFRIPTGVRAWIEDVVVDTAARGRGVGEALNRRALEIAEARACKSVDLTSRPAREAANRLYQRMGFIERNTHVYRYQGGDA